MTIKSLETGGVRKQRSHRLGWFFRYSTFAAVSGANQYWLYWGGYLPANAGYYQQGADGVVVVSGKSFRRAGGKYCNRYKY